jgi:tRNA pseudouridine32 synthase/23S rRNA pseudouridine746 synthase
MSSATEHLEVHIKIETAEASAVDLLSEATGLSRQQIKAAMHKGAVWTTRKDSARRLRRATRELAPGDELHLYYNAKVIAEAPPTPRLLADIGGYSVWHKPRGMRSQGSKWGDHCTIMRWAEQHLKPQRNSFTVHRLDLNTNGLILVAHSKTDAAALAKLFRERQIDKTYRAIVKGNFSQQPVPLRIEQPVNDKAAASEISFLALSNNQQQSLVDVRIETGRKHQIRQHLAGIGYPIVGDRLYGSGETDGVDMQLTAYRLAFICPVQLRPVEYLLPDELLPKLQ